MRRRNPPIGSDSTLSGHTVHLGEDDRYVLPEMEASVKRAAGEPTSGKRYPRLDPVTGEILGWGGSKTLKPDWMRLPGKRGQYYGAEETLKALGTLRGGKWPRTKRQEEIASQVEQALYLDAETEKTIALGGPSEDTSPATPARPLPAFVTQEESRPRVLADRSAGTFTLRPRSPYKGSITMVNLPGHKRGCRCVGCSPATRARGMAALRRRAGGQSAGSRRNAQPARPPAIRFFSRPSLKEVAHSAGQDAGNRSMRKAGRKQWSQADWNAAAREFHRVLGTDLGEGNPQLSPKASAFISRHVRKHIRTDRMPPRRAVRAAYEEARGKGFKVPKAPNPPRSVGVIPGRLTRVEYVRLGKHPGRYYHNFGPGVKAYPQADGSILLKGPRRLFVRQ